MDHSIFNQHKNILIDFPEKNEDKLRRKIQFVKEQKSVSLSAQMKNGFWFLYPMTG